LLESWNTATITALAAIGGSLVGALGSSASTWIAQRHQDRREFLARKISHPEQLYSDFMNENAKVIVDALQHTCEDPGKLIPTYALLGRIRLSSSKSVVESAERVVTHILGTYSERNLTPEEIQSGATSITDPLRDFSNVCRAELESLWAAS